MIENWRETLCKRAEEWRLPTGGEWSFIFHNNYQPANSTINLLWFHGKDRYPCAVTKMSADHDVLSREFESLQLVNRLAPQCTPRPIELGYADGFWMLWMQGVAGTRIPVRREYRIPMLVMPVDAITSIHKGVNQGVSSNPAERHARIVATPIQTVLGSNTSVAVRAGCLALLEKASFEWLQKLPVIPQHGDLYLDNVLHNADRYNIVDWEGFGIVDLPFYDVVTLLLSFLRASGATPEQWSPALCKQIPMLLKRYIDALQLTPAALGTLLPLTLLNRFYLHWVHGRTAAATVMYSELDHYFEHTSFWNDVFLRE